VKLKEARARKLLAMRALADASGVSLATIRNAEAGRYVPSLSVARKLADALGIEPAEVDEFRASMEAAIQGRGARHKVGGSEPAS